MIRHYIRILTDRLATDVQGLRLQNATLEAAVAKAIEERQEAEREAVLYVDAMKRAMDDVERLRTDLAWAEAKIKLLRPLAGNTEATTSERLMLDIVGKSPGLLADEYARMFAMVDPDYPTEHPSWGILQNHRKHLSSLHRKALVRRERAGQSYRYWVAGE